MLTIYMLDKFFEATNALNELEWELITAEEGEVGEMTEEDIDLARKVHEEIELYISRLTDIYKREQRKRDLAFKLTWDDLDS